MVSLTNTLTYVSCMCRVAHTSRTSLFSPLCRGHSLFLCLKSAEQPLVLHALLFAGLLLIYVYYFLLESWLLLFSLAIPVHSVVKAKPMKSGILMYLHWKYVPLQYISRRELCDFTRIDHFENTLLLRHWHDCCHCR